MKPSLKLSSYFSWNLYRGLLVTIWHCTFGQGNQICLNVFSFYFCLVPFLSRELSKSSSKQYKCLSSWNIQRASLFLLKLSILVSESYMSIHKWKMLQDQMWQTGWVASAQTAAMPVENSSEVWRQIHVLTSNQNHSYYIQLLQKCTRRSERWIEISQLKITPTCQWATE